MCKGQSTRAWFVERQVLQQAQGFDCEQGKLSPGSLRVLTRA